jgi:site-specific recombinase
MKQSAATDSRPEDTRPEDVLQFEFASARARATWVYGMLRSIMNVPRPLRTARLQLLTARIDEHPHRDEIRMAFREFWSHHSYVRVISEAGLPDETFLARELFVRAAKRLLPEDEVRGDLYVLLDSLGLKERDAGWVASLPDELVAWWADIFRLTTPSLLASCKILALRASNIALSRDMLILASDDDVTKSPFFHLPSLVESVVLHPEEYPRWEEQRDRCIAQMREFNQRMESEGTSAGVIFRLRLLRSFLWRIDQVLALRRPAADGRKFAAALIQGFASQRRILKVVSTTFRRMARSLVEKTGRVGVHYIAKNAQHWRGMGLGAIMAGIITCFTALVKYSISAKIQAPFLVALGHSLNYAISFLLMQAGGFLLASKMPAATAATLVDAMEDPAKDHMASLRAISQTQTIVTLGNLLGAIPASIAVDRIWQAVAHHPFLTQAEAEHGVHMVILHQSGTIAYAIVTGVLLWFSSLATGWTANYVAVSKMDAAISNSLRVRERLGLVKATRLAHWVKHNAAGSVGYIVLGFLLGTVPILVTLFGIPLEVRHVTLSAASLGYALDGMWYYSGLSRHDMIASLLGVLLIGVLNITTSFVLSFLLALRARDVGQEKARRFLREVGRELLANPGSFLLPSRTKTVA